MDTKALHIEMDAALVARVDEYRWQKRLASRKEALETLISRALLLSTRQPKRKTEPAAL